MYAVQIIPYSQFLKLLKAGKVTRSPSPPIRSRER